MSAASGAARFVPLRELVSHRAGNGQLIKGRHSPFPACGLVQGFSASGPDVWVPNAEYEGPGVVVSAVGHRCGKAFLADGRWTAIANTHVLRPSRELDVRYLWHLVNDEGFWVRGGSAQPFIKVKATLEHPVRLPSLDEQHRIVAVLEDHLSRLDAGGRYLASVRQRSATMATASAEAHLLSGASDVATARHAAVTDAGRLPTLEEGWRWFRLEQLCDVVGGITKDAGKQHAAGLVEVPYLRVANVQRARLDLSIVKSMRVPVAKAAALRLVRGDVLMNEGGDRDKLGRGWVWSGELDDCIHQNHVFRARVRGDAIRPKLLSWWTNTVGGEWCQRHGRQSVNLASVSLNRIRQMPVPVPPVDEQEHLEAAIDEVHEGVARLRESALALGAGGSRLRAELLSAAVAGRL